MDTAKWIMTIQFFCMFLSFVSAIPTINNSSIPGYMKFFYVYTLIALLLTIFSLLNKCFDLVDNISFMKISISSILFHYTFLSIFIYSVLKKKLLKAVLVLVFISFFCLVVYQLFTSLSGNNNRYSYATANLVLIVFCMMYFYELISETLPRRIFVISSFWVVAGIFISMSPIVILAGFERYLLSNLAFEENIAWAYVGGIAYSILHLFFSKAYLCSLKELRR